MRSRLALRLAPASPALLLLALAACAGSQGSPAWTACKNAARGAEALQAKVAACTGLLNGALQPDDLALALKARADGYRDLEKYDLAVADDTRAIGLDASDSRAVSDRGLARYGQGRLDLALSDFNQALRIDSGNDAALNGRAYVERQNNDEDAAIRDESRAIELDPKWTDPWLVRGLAYLDKGWFDMALADFADVLRLDGAEVDAFDGVGRAQSGKGDNADAVSAYLSASSVYLDRDNYDGAVSEADKAVNASPDDPEALNGRCWARAVAGDELDRAEADCQRSLAAKPRDGETLDSLAFVRFRQGRFDEALKGFNDALAQDPKQSASLYMRGIVKLRLGDQAGGQSDLQAAQNQDAGVAARYSNWGVNADTQSP